MRKFFACMLVVAIVMVNLGTISFAVSSKGILVPYVLSDSAELDFKSSFAGISGEVPKYYYSFNNGKSRWDTYSLLDDCQKKIYNTIVNAPIGTLSIDFTFDYGEFSYSNFTEKYFSEVMYAICNDRPDIFYYKGYVIPAFYLHDNTCVKNFTYNISIFSSSTYNESNISGYYDTLVSAMKNVPVDLSNRYNFVKSVHDYLCSTIYYPDLNTSEYTGNAHDAYGALVEKTAVCQGYSEAFEMICDYYKVPCVSIYGTGVTSNGSGAHMWNAVQMDDGLWYYIDATWNDQTDQPVNMIFDDFFLVGSKTNDTHFGGLEFSQSHIADTSVPLPALKYGTQKYSNNEHFTEFGATYNSIAKKDGKYLIRSYFDVYDSFIYYNGIYVEVNSPATNSTFIIKSNVENIEEEWTVVSICDCNGDGLANADDYSEAVNKVLNGTPVATAYDMAADANCDSVLDVIDLAIIQRAVTEKNTDIVLE